MPKPNSSFQMQITPKGQPIYSKYFSIQIALTTSPDSLCAACVRLAAEKVSRVVSMNTNIKLRRQE
jgi:hypothetical protein